MTGDACVLAGHPCAGPTRGGDALQQVLRLGFKRPISDGQVGRAAGEPFGLVGFIPAKKGIRLLGQFRDIGEAIGVRILVDVDNSWYLRMAASTLSGLSSSGW